jgi:lipoprotein-anchoring transpeptidase ErfK/SrfK
VTYTVKRGDTLVKIAQRYGVNVNELARSNQIPNPSSIKPGLVLTIPNGTSGSAAGSAPSSPSSSGSTAGSGGGKHILVDISDQRLWAYEGDNVVYEFVASTGINNWTRTGTFRIQSKMLRAWSGWGFWMPYWMGIYWVGTAENGIHSLPVLTNGREIWGDQLGTPATYGCVMLSPGDSKRLYEWANIGTPVEIRR